MKTTDRIFRDFVLGWCLVIDGLRLIVLPGVFLRPRGLAIRWTGYYAMKYTKKKDGVR